VVSQSEYCLFEDNPRQINSGRNEAETNRICTKHVDTLQPYNLGEIYQIFPLVACLQGKCTTSVTPWRCLEGLRVFRFPQFHFNSLFPTIYGCGAE